MANLVISTINILPVGAEVGGSLMKDFNDNSLLALCEQPTLAADSSPGRYVRVKKNEVQAFQLLGLKYGPLMIARFASEKEVLEAVSSLLPKGILDYPITKLAERGIVTPRGKPAQPLVPTKKQNTCYYLLSSLPGCTRFDESYLSGLQGSKKSSSLEIYLCK